MDALPVQYHIEIYERTFVNDPSVSFSTCAPLLALSVGDTFDHRGFDTWHEPPGAGQDFQVIAVRHFIWAIEGSHVGHKVMVCVAAAPSPA